MATTRPSIVGQRMISVARLQPEAFEEIENDVSSTVWAAVIVILTGFSAGLASMYTPGSLNLFEFAIGGLISGVFIGMSSSFSLLVFTTAAFIVGGLLLRTEATSVNWPELFRVLGFAGIPLLFVPWLLLIHLTLATVAIVWFAALVIMGIRQALDFDTSRAVATFAIALAVTTMVQTIAIFVFSVILYVAIYGHL